MNCSYCGGDLIHMGRLGLLVWFRCRQCGLDQHNNPTTQKRLKARRAKD